MKVNLCISILEFKFKEIKNFIYVKVINLCISILEFK